MTTPAADARPTEEQLAAIRAAYDSGVTVLHSRTEIGVLLTVVDELLTELDGRDEKARKKWVKKQEKQLGIKYADFREGRWEMDLAMGREMAAAYVAMAKTMLGDAPNYSETRLEFDVKIAESPEIYTLVVQRHARGVLTPHEARQKAERERDEVLTVLWQIREARSLGAALAAVASFDGLTSADVVARSKEQPR